MEIPQEMRDYVDLDAGLARVRGNRAIYSKMLGMFMASTEIPALEEALCAEDWPRAADLAHGVKGMTGNLGFTRLFEVSAQLMVAARLGKPGDTLIAAYREAEKKTRVYVEEAAAMLSAG